MFHQIFTVTGPVFAMLVIGSVLKRTRLIDDAFIATASNLSFRLLMPALLFFSVFKADLETAFQPRLIGYFYFATTLSFVLAWLWSLRNVPPEDRGVYVQGAFRGNCGVVGLALAASYYGDYGLSVGGVMAGMGIFLVNILSVIVLSTYSQTYDANILSVIKSIARNPLVVAVTAGLIGSLLGLSLPEWVMISGDYLVSLTLPLALISIGGSLSLHTLRKGAGLALSASLMKVLVTPVLLVLLAIALGFSGRDLGMLFLFLASPTAAVSYVMARAANSDEKLAANIIVISTLISVVTILTGLVCLTAWGKI